MCPVVGHQPPHSPPIWTRYTTRFPTKMQTTVNLLPISGISRRSVRRSKRLWLHSKYLLQLWLIRRPSSHLLPIINGKRIQHLSSSSSSSSSAWMNDPTNCGLASKLSHKIKWISNAPNHYTKKIGSGQLCPYTLHSAKYLLLSLVAPYVRMVVDVELLTNDVTKRVRWRPTRRRNVLRASPQLYAGYIRLAEISLANSYLISLSTTR